MLRRPALGGGRQALQRLRAARRRPDRGRALQGRPAELRRVRREARVRAGPDAGPDLGPRACASACRSARTSGPTRSCECLAETGGEILLVPNGSPYWRDKNDMRINIAVARVTESGLPLVYLNQVGGQDELVFDGASFVLNADGSLAAQLPAFREEVGDHALAARGGRLALRRRPEGAAGRRATRPTTPPACSACATMSRRTASPAWCWASPAASIPRCARRWRSMRWARTACTASCCPTATPRSRASTTPRPAPRALGVRYDIVPIGPRRGGHRGRASRRCSPGGRRTSPRRTCRAACAARS